MVPLTTRAVGQRNRLLTITGIPLGKNPREKFPPILNPSLSAVTPAPLKSGMTPRGETRYVVGERFLCFFITQFVAKMRQTVFREAR